MTSNATSNVDNDDLICPITYQIFRDPVIAGDGHTYERAAIVRWIIEHGTSPLTRQPLNLKELQADDYLKNLAAQRRSSSISSNHNINLDQLVLQQQNSTMSYNYNIYIDQPLFLQQQTMINNNVPSINNTQNCNEVLKICLYLTRCCIIIVTIITLLIIGLYKLWYNSNHNDFVQSISSKRKLKQNGITIAGGNGQGDQLNQTDFPSGIYIDDDDQSIYIADSGNDRIVQWKFGAKNGKIVAGGNGKGGRIDQLYFPTDVIVDKINNSLIICDAGIKRVVKWPRQNGKNGQTIISDISCSGLKMDKNGNLYVSDNEKNEVRRYKIGDNNGTIVAGGNGKGNHLNQLNWPTYIFVDKDYSVYVSDSWNHRVMKWIKDAKEGIIVAGGNGHGNSLTQLNDPRGVIVDHLGNIYVVDSMNDRVMLWLKGSKKGIIVFGRNEEEQQLNLATHLLSISFDRQGNLYVVEPNNNRVQKFDMVSN